MGGGEWGGEGRVNSDVVALSDTLGKKMLKVGSLACLLGKAAPVPNSSWGIKTKLVCLCSALHAYWL